MTVRKESRINLLRYQQEEALESKKNNQFVLILGLVALLLAGAMGGAWWSQNQNLQTVKAENIQLQQQVDKLTSSVVSTDTVTKGSGEVDKRSSMINTLQKQVRVKSKHFQDIYLLSIPGITIGKMDVKSDNNFAMSAYCSSQAKFIKFLKELRELDFIKEVKNISSKCNTKTGEVNFNIILVWEEVE